jgi:hypothetical protein
MELIWREHTRTMGTTLGTLGRSILDKIKKQIGKQMGDAIESLEHWEHCG